ncbi:MAG: hypothetical protein WC806_03970 [Candidatus Gracilibacteria bacterium]|jgi:uncharacterized membrane protein
MTEQQKKADISINELKQDLKTLNREKKWAILCYIPVINVITCTFSSVIMASSQFCRFHARQGFILFAFLFITMFSSIISPTISLMLWGIVFLVHFSAMIMSIRGDLFKIPILGNFADKIPEYYVYELLTGKKHEQASANVQEISKKS